MTAPAARPQSRWPDPGAAPPPGTVKPPGDTLPRTLTEKLLALRDPFPVKDLEWRVLRAGVKENGEPWAIVSAYVDNRAIVERLDEVIGPAGWRDEFREWNAGKPGVLCGISLKIDGEWVTKWDGAEQPREKDDDTGQPVAVKGGFSGAEKRAASKWGIGRYLYDAGDLFAVIRQGGRFRGQAKPKNGPPVRFQWDPPDLPPEFLPAKERAAADARISALRDRGRGGAR